MKGVLVPKISCSFKREIFCLINILKPKKEENFTKGNIWSPSFMGIFYGGSFWSQKYIGTTKGKLLVPKIS